MIAITQIHNSKPALRCAVGVSDGNDHHRDRCGQHDRPQPLTRVTRRFAEIGT